MFRKVLIANRGTIACRIARTLRKMGIASVAVYSEADRHSLHVRMCDEAVPIGPAQASLSYLATDALLAAVRATGAEAVHPGYGFLSENAAFAEACEAAGVVFIGPTPEQLRSFGLKHTARALAHENGVPLLPGTELLASVDEALQQAERIGYPVMLKSTAGGGGIGMQLCRSARELEEGYAAWNTPAAPVSAASGLYLEKFVSEARHIEVQIFGDGLGEVLAFGERDCSAQRRNQKVIEETPAPGLPKSVRRQLFDASIRLGRAVRYRSAGTVEFLYDAVSRDFYFLEVNTRLQVEHGVTEEVTGIDLVGWMVRQAAGEMPSLARIAAPRPLGSSIQVRCYAEDPGKQFQPSSGRLLHVAWPVDCRVETWVETGTEVTSFYDPMLAKIIVCAEDREGAVRKMAHALDETQLSGIETNLEYLRQVIASPAFVAGGIATSFLRVLNTGGILWTCWMAACKPRFRIIRVAWVLERRGSSFGADRPIAFRAANRLAGNEEIAPALEITLTGPTLQFNAAGLIALTGADFGAILDASPWSAGRQSLFKQLNFTNGRGERCWRSRLFGGGGWLRLFRILRQQQHIHPGWFRRAIRARVACRRRAAYRDASGEVAAFATVPQYENSWTIGVIYGPHGAPDYFTERDIETLFSATWTVHHNSDRTGIRLIGPKPEWARKDGGEAGLHPSIFTTTRTPSARWISRETCR